VSHLWDEVLGTFENRGRDLPRRHEWLEAIHSHEVLRRFWNDVPVPFTVFLMRALPNERVFRYFEIESDHFCLRAFQNAGLEIGRVRIPWGLGVVSRLLREPSFRSGDLFREPAVVFKRQDVVQGNRSIIMARWPSSGVPQWRALSSNTSLVNRRVTSMMSGFQRIDIPNSFGQFAGIGAVCARRRESVPWRLVLLASPFVERALFVVWHLRVNNRLVAPTRRPNIVQQSAPLPPDNLIGQGHDRTSTLPR